MVLQQLHFRSLISNNVRDGHKWVYKTYEEWKNDEFPFWSVVTNKRAIRRLKVKGFIFAPASYNWVKMEKMKWYRIYYIKLQLETEQHATVPTAKSAEEEAQIAPATEGEMPLAIAKEI